MRAKFLPFCSRSQWSEHVDFRSFSLRRMSKCFIQIGVQKPTTINAFTEAQKFIIISVISKGFSSCLASEQDLKDYSENGQSWLQRQILICILNHHSESQMYFLSLVIAYDSNSRPQSLMFVRNHNKIRQTERHFSR